MVPIHKNTNVATVLCTATPSSIPMLGSVWISQEESFWGTFVWLQFNELYLKRRHNAQNCSIMCEQIPLCKCKIEMSKISEILLCILILIYEYFDVW